MYKIELHYFFESFQPIISYMPTTLIVTFGSFLLSIILAIIIAVISMSKNRIIDAILKIWLSLFRGTPVLCQLFLFVYGIFPNVPGIKDFPAVVQAIICLSLSYSAYMSETIRGAIISIDKGQMEAAMTIGMNKLQAYRRIILPQAFRLAVPGLSNNFLDVFKGSSLTSMVGILDMMLRAKMLANKTYRFIEVYLCVVLVYWALNVVFTYLQKLLENKTSAKY